MDYNAHWSVDCYFEHLDVAMVSLELQVTTLNERVKRYDVIYK